MLFAVAFFVLFCCPFAPFFLHGECDLTTVAVFFGIGIFGWVAMIRAYKKEKEKKRRRNKTMVRQYNRRRNEDDFLNNYGYIDNSAFGSIDSFTHHKH